MTINEAKDLEVVSDFGTFDEILRNANKIMLYETYYMNTIYELAKKYGFEDDESYKNANMTTDLVGMKMRYRQLKEGYDTLKKESLVQRIYRKIKKGS